MKDPFRIMIVDDSAVIRGLLTRALESEPAFAVIASVANGKQALTTVAQHDIEIIVLDIEMPVMDGMTALPLLLKAKPGVQVLMASTLTRKNADISLRAMTMGAAVDRLLNMRQVIFGCTKGHRGMFAEYAQSRVTRLEHAGEKRDVPVEYIG